MKGHLFIWSFFLVYFDENSHFVVDALNSVDMQFTPYRLASHLPTCTEISNIDTFDCNSWWFTWVFRNCPEFKNSFSTHVLLTQIPTIYLLCMYRDLAEEMIARPMRMPITTTRWFIIEQKKIPVEAKIDKVLQILWNNLDFDSSNVDSVIGER